MRLFSAMPAREATQGTTRTHDGRTTMKVPQNVALRERQMLHQQSNNPTPLTAGTQAGRQAGRISNQNHELRFTKYSKTFVMLFLLPPSARQRFHPPFRQPTDGLSTKSNPLPASLSSIPPLLSLLQPRLEQQSPAPNPPLSSATLTIERRATKRTTPQFQHSPP